MQFPSMVRIEQKFNTASITDIQGEIRSRFIKFEPEKTILPGQSVAVTAGSRGIYKIADILTVLVNELKGIGANPFIIPAMGSHGNATSEGQMEVLKHYGITENATGVPIKSSMEVVRIGKTSEGIPVLIDKNASQADHVVVVNRIKPHTDFEGDIESGLMKMIAIGLGKQKASDRYHNEFMIHGHCNVITSVAQKVIENCPIAFGLGVVENQKDETQIIRFIPPGEIEKAEKELLTSAKRLMPRIPLEDIDILIVDEMGKDVSGTGMDQNVIGRTVVPYHKVPRIPRIGRIIVRDLSENSYGNATGVGNADFATKRLVDKIDREATYMNAITSSCPEIIRIPPYYDDDRQAIEAALETLPRDDPENARIVHIRNTLRLDEMYISEALATEVRGKENIGILGIPDAMKFDREGNLALNLC